MENIRCILYYTRPWARERDHYGDHSMENNSNNRNKKNG